MTKNTPFDASRSCKWNSDQKRSRVHYDQVEMRLKVGKQFSDALFGNF